MWGSYRIKQIHKLISWKRNERDHTDLRLYGRIKENGRIKEQCDKECAGVQQCPTDGTERQQQM